MCDGHGEGAERGGGERGRRVIQRDRDGSTAPGSLELLMRSPPSSSHPSRFSLSLVPPLNRSLFSLSLFLC